MLMMQLGEEGIQGPAAGHTDCLRPDTGVVDTQCACMCMCVCVRVGLSTSTWSGSASLRVLFDQVRVSMRTWGSRVQLLYILGFQDSESENHRRAEVRKVLCGPSSLTPLLKQGCLDQVAQECVQVSLGSLQRRRPQLLW